ncbi:MAG: DUF6020 family protein [Bacilli bacterium]|nr:DUF6020 family protein [Bacilli bacterium]MDD4808803.1 DUF6020 family protein [Bacilli bacterium]
MNKVKYNKYYSVFIILLLSIVTLISLCLNINLNGKINPLYIFKDHRLTMFFIVLILYSFNHKNYIPIKDSNFIFKLLAFLFSLFLVIGNSYENVGNGSLIFGSLSSFVISGILIFSYYHLNLWMINFFYQFINESKRFKLEKPDKWSQLIFENHPMLGSIIIMLICWLPYIIAFYPAILSPDPSNQIKQFFGLETHYIESVNIIDEDVLITNHHPVLHTILLGSSLKIGRVLGSDNFGLFIYSMIQISILVSALAFTINYTKKLKTPYWVRWVILIIYSLAPVFPFYAMSAVKDVIFTSLIILYTILLFELIDNKEKINTKKMIRYILLILLIMLFRNNGIYVIILSFPFFFFITKQNRFQLGLILVTPILLYQGYSNILLPAFGITPGSIREALSIPFQQTARYVKYDNRLTEEETKVIDKLLDYDTLAERYNPVLSDPVKNQFNPDYNKEDLSKYFRVWFNGLKKHPDLYLEATIHNTYGYFYPNTSKWYIYYKYDSRLQETGLFDYHYNDLSGQRKVLSLFGIAYPYIPIIGMMVNIGFGSWVIMMMSAFLITLKKYKYLIVLLPSLSLLLICIASPANTYFRYAMPYIFSIPILLAILIKINQNKGEIKYEK